MDAKRLTLITDVKNLVEIYCQTRIVLTNSHTYRPLHRGKLYRWPNMSVCVLFYSLKFNEVNKRDKMHGSQ